ncbi:hypothetical protein [Pseudostreptobacillus hongkongensis]|nr:hypothetical protein [Pseudostreptobacillus hongkongensis]
MKNKNISKEFKDVKFVTVENGGHFFDRRFNEIAEREIKDFLNKNIEK